jgi:bacterioferritin-associated ferredoxin
VIVCSCHVLSDAQVRSAVASAAPRPRMSHVYASLGCAAKCGRCAHTIKILLEEIRRFATAGTLAPEAARVH